MTVGGLVASCRRPRRDPQACRAEAHALAAMLGSFDHRPSAIAEELHLVVRADLPPDAPAWGPVIAVGATVSVDREPVADRSALDQRLVALRARLDAMAPRGGADPAVVVLAIDAQAPWSTVVWVADAARAAGFDHPALVFARPAAPVTPPPRSSIDAELDAVAGDNKATQVARIAARVARSCPALIRVFGEVSAGTDDRAQQLIDGIEPALIACNCDLDIAALRSLMFRVLFVPRPTTALAIALAADGRRIALPAATPWSTAHAQVTVGAPLSLAVAP